MFRYVHNYLKYSMWCKPEYEEILDEQIKNNPVVIVGLTWCPWTKRSKDLIKKEYNIDPTVIAPDILTKTYKVNILYCVCKKVNTYYVPQIWINQQHVGDFEHLYKMHHRNQIQNLFESGSISKKHL
jgi:glutaredoxin